MLTVKEKIPALLGYDAEGKAVTADEFAGKALIVYFYPKDSTPGCTAEACSLRDGYADLTTAGFTVIGISRDSAASHARFAQKNALPFRLLSDPEGEVCQAYGVWQKKKLAGREYMGIVRTTFVTDATHTITHVITKVDTKNAATQLLTAIKK